MVRWMARGMYLFALLMVAHAALAQEFSADVVSTKNNNGGVKKIYVGTDKIRFEVQGGNAAMGASAVILDETEGKYVVVLGDKHMYMDAPQMMVKPLITQFWRVPDANDACTQWRKAAAQAGTDQELGQLHEDW